MLYLSLSCHSHLRSLLLTAQAENSFSLPELFACIHICSSFNILIYSRDYSLFTVHQVLFSVYQKALAPLFVTLGCFVTTCTSELGRQLVSRAGAYLSCLSTQIKVGFGVAFLQCQHLGDRGRRTTQELQVNLISMVNSRLTKQRKPVPKRPKRAKAKTDNCVLKKSVLKLGCYFIINVDQFVLIISSSFSCAPSCPDLGRQSHQFWRWNQCLLYARQAL